MGAAEKGASSKSCEGGQEKVQRGLSLELSFERSSELPVREATKRRCGVRGAPARHLCNSGALSDPHPAPRGL